MDVLEKWNLYKLYTIQNFGLSVYFQLNGLTGLTAYQRTYTAKTNVDLLYLTYEEAEKIFEVFPEEKTEILERLAAAYDTLIEDGENLEEDSSESDESYESTSDPATSS